MGELKTQRTDASVDDLIAGIEDDARRQDCLELLELMKRVTGEEPAVWGSAMIGFGTYHYKSASGQEGDWFPVGFASRKAAITVYLGFDIEEHAETLSTLGKYKPGKGCIYIKRLSDVDPLVLGQVVHDAYESVMRAYA